MSRIVMLTVNSFFSLSSPKKVSIENKMATNLFGILQDCMIMAAIVMFGMALTLLIGS